MKAGERVEGVVYSPAELLPEAWRSVAGSDPVRTFNPGLLADGDGWLFAYRVVARDGLRRIALCRLDRSLRIVSGSPVPLSDGFRLREEEAYPDVVRNWFADPRLYRFGGRLFVYWNSGWHEPRNYQFLHELDPKTFQPVGRARELVLASGARQKLEKNWTFFCAGGNEYRAVYSVTPHRVLAFALDSREAESDVVFEEVANTNWSLEGYPPSHGGLRGGTPPQPAGAGWVSFCHSVHDGPTGYRYVAAAYRFDGAAPFAPTHRPYRALRLYNPFGEGRVHGALNPAVAEVLYPCGAARAGDHWLVSHGINDEHCAISILADEEVEDAMRSIIPQR